MKLFIFSALLSAAQANFFRRHRGRNGFLGSGIRHSGENFHAVFALADVNDLGATSVEYFDCGTGTAAACMSTTAIGNITALSVGVNTPQTGQSVNVTTSNVGNSHLFEVEFTPSSVANHILTVIDINGQDVMEESYVCDAGHKVEADGSCSPCPVGQYAELGAVACTACPDSATSSATGSDQVTDCECPAGTYATVNGCSACPANTYNAAGDHVGTASTCDTCPDSSTSAVGSDEKSDCLCPAGTGGSATGCTACPANTYNADNDPVGTATTCDTCPDSSTSAVGSDEKSDCLCPAGTGGSATGCGQCALGKYDAGGDQAGQSGSCTLCGAGKWSDTLGAVAESTCEECGMGKWSDTLGANAESTCTNCGAGKYLDTTGNDAITECIDCPQGKVSVPPADALNDCQYRSLMYGYALMVDAPNTCTDAPCACTKTCVQWHGGLIEGFTIAERGAAGIVVETDTTICGMLKQTGELIKQEGCTGN